MTTKIQFGPDSAASVLLSDMMPSSDYFSIERLALNPYPAGSLRRDQIRSNTRGKQNHFKKFHDPFIKQGIKIGDNGRVGSKDFIEETYRGRYRPYFFPKKYSARKVIYNILENLAGYNRYLIKEREIARATTFFQDQVELMQSRDWEGEQKSWFYGALDLTLRQYFPEFFDVMAENIVHAIFNISNNAFGLQDIGLHFDCTDSENIFCCHNRQPEIVNVIYGIEINTMPIVWGSIDLGQVLFSKQPNGSDSDSGDSISGSGSFGGEDEPKKIQLIEHLRLTKYGWKVEKIIVMGEELQQYLRFGIYRAIRFVMQLSRIEWSRFRRSSQVSVALRNIMSRIVKIYLDVNDAESEGGQRLVNDWSSWVYFLLAEKRLPENANKSILDLLLERRSSLLPDMTFDYVKKCLSKYSGFEEEFPQTFKKVFYPMQRHMLRR